MVPRSNQHQQYDNHNQSLQPSPPHHGAAQTNDHEYAVGDWIDERAPSSKAAVNSVLFAVAQTSGAQKNEVMIDLIENYANKVRLDCWFWSRSNGQEKTEQNILPR